MEPLISFSGLSIERLKSFCEIVEAGSVVGASSRHGISQAQYSRQIKDLEKALDSKLFVRQGKFLRLTTDGLKLAAITRSYFGALADLRAGPDGLGKPLRLGAAESIVRWLLVPRIPEVLSAVGGQLEIRTRPTDELVAQLSSGELDVGIFRADAASDELETFPFPGISYVLMVPRSLLPEKSATGIRNITTIPLILLTGDGRFVRLVERVITTNGLPTRIVARVEMFSLAVELAKTMSAATFVPSSAIAEFPADSFTPVSLDGMDTMQRKLVLGVNKRTATLNTRASRAALKLSRAYESSARKP